MFSCCGDLCTALVIARHREAVILLSKNGILFLAGKDTRISYENPGSYQGALIDFYPSVTVAKLWQNYPLRSGLIGSSPVSDSTVSD